MAPSPALQIYAICVIAWSCGTLITLIALGATAGLTITDTQKRPRHRPFRPVPRFPFGEEKPTPVQQRPAPKVTPPHLFGEVLILSGTDDSGPGGGGIAQRESREVPRSFRESRAKSLARRPDSQPPSRSRRPARCQPLTTARAD